MCSSGPSNPLARWPLVQADVPLCFVCSFQDLRLHVIPPRRLQVRRRCRTSCEEACTPRSTCPGRQVASAQPAALFGVKDPVLPGHVGCHPVSACPSAAGSAPAVQLGPGHPVVPVSVLWIPVSPLAANSTAAANAVQPLTSILIAQRPLHVRQGHPSGVLVSPLPEPSLVDSCASPHVITSFLFAWMVGWAALP